MGNLSKVVSEALTEAERKNEELKREVDSLEFQKENSFKAPPQEWINHRLENLRETLNKNTVSSALALKELLAPISLEPILTKGADFYQLFGGDEKEFKPYYVAHIKIRTLALLDEKYQNSSGTAPCGDSPFGGPKSSNWYQFRRTVSVCLPLRSNYISKMIYLHRALGRCRISRASVALPWGRAPLAFAWPLTSC